MGKITYLIANYNNGKYIRDCIDSLISQSNEDWLALICDDASTDNSLEIIRPYLSSQITLICNKQNQGYIRTLKRLISESKTDIVGILDPDDALCLQATEEILRVYKQQPTAAFVYTLFEYYDERLTKAFKIGCQEPKKGTSLEDGFIGHLKTFKRKCYYQTSGLDETILYAEDRDLIYKLEEVTQPICINKVLYKHRVVSRSQSHDRKCHEIGLRNHIIARKKALQRRQIYGIKNYLYCILFLLDYLHQTYYTPKIIKCLTSHMLVILRHILFSYFSIRSKASCKHIAYYLWQYPALSETFIQREILALQQPGVSLKVIADRSGDLSVMDKKAHLLAQKVNYIFPIRITKFLKYNFYFCITSPILLLRIFFYIVRCSYCQNKTIREDIRIFFKAIYLAGILRENNINHAHCPWAEVNAFILLIASKFTGIPYSIQARAHELHRESAKYALAEKLGQAKFIVINCQFNRALVEQYLPKKNPPIIHLIYEGIFIKDFQPKEKKFFPEKIYTILSVARLVEYKGLDYLLRACQILKERKIKFHCKIIGGAEEPLYSNYPHYLNELKYQLGLESEVTFCGSQPFSAVLKAYQKADIFVLPAVKAADGTQDITPNSIIEAMAMKLPVISTFITGIPEIIENDVSGLLIAPKNHYALADTIIKLIDNPELTVRQIKNFHV